MERAAIDASFRDKLTNAGVDVEAALDAQAALDVAFLDRSNKTRIKAARAALAVL